MLPFKIISQDEFTAIALDEAKTQCRLLSSNTRDDDYIGALILSAAASAQEYLHWMVSTGVVTQYASDGGVIKLYGRYITEITEVLVDGETLAEEDYSYNPITDEITVVGTEVFVTYSCGASTADLPKNVKCAMLMLISTMYNNREDFITGLSVEAMPLTSKKLLGLSREYVS